jgi:type II secretion system protein N
MKDFTSKHKKWLGFVLYAVILTVGLLYFRFPSDALKDYFQVQANRASPPLRFSVERIKPSIPPGLKFVKAGVSLKDPPRSLILNADRLLIKPSLWSVFGGERKYSFHCIAYKGDVSGRINFQKDQAAGFVDTQMALRNIHLGDYAYVSSLMGRSVAGTLGGTISYRGQYNLLLNGSGEANLSLADGKLELARPFLTLESLDFDAMEIDMVLDKQSIRVTRLEFKGPQLQGTLSGTISLKREFAESVLDLKGTIQPFAALFTSPADAEDTVAFLRERLSEGTFTFMIQGTMGNPQIKFT